MEELRLKIIELINNSNLTPEATLFVIKDIYRDVLDAYNQWLQVKDNPKPEQVDAEIVK